MKNNGPLKKYLYKSLAGAGSIIICILVFFAMYRFDQIVAAYNLMKGILMPFIYGAVIAYLLTPVCNFIERHLFRFLESRMKKPEKAHGIAGAAGIGLSMVFSLLVIYLLIAMVMPQVFSSIGSIVTAFPSMVNKWSAWIQNYLQDNEIVWNYVNQFIDTVSANVESWLETKLLPNMQTIVSGVSAGLLGAIVVMKNILIGLIAAIYMMGNRRKFAAQAKKLIYSAFSVRHANAILDECRLIDRMFGGFISGKLIDSLIIGVLCFIVMTILRLPYTLLISLIVGITNMIPYFGPFIGAVPGAIVMLMVSPLKAVIFIIMIFALQQFDGLYLGPKILGQSVGLRPLWIIVAITIGGSIAGVLGMFLGVPIMAVLRYLVMRTLKQRLEEREVKDIERFHLD